MTTLCTARCIRQAALIGLTLLITACATRPDIVVHESPEPVVVIAPQPVALVVSRDISSYVELTDYLSAHLDRRYVVFELSSHAPDTIADAVRALQPSSVVAIGPAALDMLSPLGNIDLIYAEVFNAPGAHRGVDAIPPFAMQLEYWSRMAPQIRRIGVIGGSDMRGVMADLRAATDSLNIKLIANEVRSDKEALVAFRRMVPQIDGFVFLPDQTILSPNVIRKVINHGKRNGLQILVYSPAMYRLGASLYVGARQSDIAQQITTLIENPELKSLPLTQMYTLTHRQIASNEPR